MSRTYRSPYTKHEHNLTPPENIRRTPKGCHPKKPTGIWDRNTRRGWKPNGYLPANRFKI